MSYSELLHITCYSPQSSPVMDYMKGSSEASKIASQYLFKIKA